MAPIDTLIWRQFFTDINNKDNKSVLYDMRKRHLIEERKLRRKMEKMKYERKKNSIKTREIVILAKWFHSFKGEKREYRGKIWDFSTINCKYHNNIGNQSLVILV